MGLEQETLAELRPPAPRSWNLLILCWLVPVLALSLAAYLIASRCVQRLIAANNRSAAVMAQEMLHRDIGHIMHFVEAHAANRDFIAAMRQRDAAVVREHLKTMTRMSDQVEEVLACAPDGLVVATSGAPPQYEGSRVDPRAASYQAAIETKESCVSAAYLMRRGSQQMVVSVACPIFDLPGAIVAAAADPAVANAADKGTGPGRRRGALIGVLMCQVPLAELTTCVNKITVGAGGHILVIDHRGRVAAHPLLRFEDEPNLEYSNLEEVRRAQDGRESSVEYDDPLAEKRMVALFVPARIAGHSWVVVAQQPADEAYAPIRQTALQLSLAVAITVGMCLFAVALVRRMGRHLLDEQQSLKRLLDLYEEQRQVLAFEIHDGLAQHLTGATMTFEALSNSCRDQESQPQFAVGLELLRTCLAESRRLMSGMRPPVLDEFGVAAAINALVEDSARQSGVPIACTCDVQFDRLPPAEEIAIFRIVQECLTNALRHSGSDRVRIALVQHGNRVRIEVEDWGRGFDVATTGQGRFGLLGIRQRARLLGGRAEIESQPGSGTRIVVELPLIRALA